MVNKGAETHLRVNMAVYIDPVLTKSVIQHILVKLTISNFT